MPKPRKDFGLAFRKEITKQDERIAREIEQRDRLVTAYEVVTKDFESFKTPPWLTECQNKTPRKLSKDT